MARGHCAQHWRVYVITDVILARGRTHEEIAREAIRGGADVIQLRDKQASSRELYQVALRLRQMTREAGIPLIINDRVGIALAVDADGVHLGPEDMPADVVRKLLGPNRIVGVTATNLEQALQAQQGGADYVGLGPIFESRGLDPDPTKATGLELVRQVRQALNIPIVAIGGVSLNNVASVIQAGAQTVAAISAIVTAADIAERVQEFAQHVQSAMTNCQHPSGEGSS
ncbi:MAG: thiamine phosphate synthase [Calditrichaeota bacterium]|nr:MAG: thiamine phosphate synthase [Calditrichota bacterium]